LEEKFYKIKGFLLGLGEILSFYDSNTGYTYKFDIFQYEYENDVHEDISKLYDEPQICLKCQEVIVIDTKEIKDWKIGTFNCCKKWFFRGINLQNIAFIQFPNSKKIPLKESQ
jgi:hypothetical protein